MTSRDHRGPKRQPPKGLLPLAIQGSPVLTANKRKVAKGN